jgi:ubiquinone/menaquinone biosynthesis C-methylase UbiE
MMDIIFLNLLRQKELEIAEAYLQAASRVLELGAGTGAQAKALAQKGFDVVAIDLAASAYAQDRIFPVIDYDGHHIPVPSSSIDIVFSSNVLEHVPHIQSLLLECRRVLAPNGYSVHLMPSVAWRLWTFAVGPLAAIKSLLKLVADISKISPARKRKKVRAHLKTALAALLPLAHGIAREGFSEIWTFSALGLFYTGHMLLGRRLSLAHRKSLARVFGSAANIYVVRDL